MSDTFQQPLPPQAREKLSALLDNAAFERRTLIGYPCRQVFDYSALKPFMDFSLNNIGDPFAPSNYRLNSREFEQEVITTYARWMHGNAEDIWGYVTNGGTEGNMYGLYLARELFPDGIVYFSEDTHYSVTKILHVLGARNIMIRSQENGEMDYDDLRETLRINRDKPPIIFANIGTTMKGAIDNVPEIKRIIKSLAIPRHYIHSDAALSGNILPWVENAPGFDFAAGVDSISISGHKLVGSPVPCGIALAKLENVKRIGRNIEYVGALDTTINGSRNGLSPLILWYAINSVGEEGFRRIVAESLRLADVAIEKFKAAGIAAWRNAHSITVVFPRPSGKVMEKWQIAPYLDIAHIITLPHVDEAIIDELVADMVRWPQPLMKTGERTPDAADNDHRQGYA